jgi:hypothetical protein
MLKLKGTAQTIQQDLKDLILEDNARYAGVVEETTLADWEAMEKDLKECQYCGRIKYSNPTPDGDEICPDCESREMLDFE